MRDVSVNLVEGVGVEKFEDALARSHFVFGVLRLNTRLTAAEGDLFALLDQMSDLFGVRSHGKSLTGFTQFIKIFITNVTNVSNLTNKTKEKFVLFVYSSHS